jgi:hypothetical protein
MLLNELFEVSQDLVSRYKTAAIKDVDRAIAAKAAGTMGRDEYERKMTKRGRGTAAAQRRLTPQGTRLDLTPYGDAIQRDYDRYRTDEQGVAEGSSGVSVRQWANQVRKDHGPDVKFRNRQEGGGAVDSVIAKNSQGETVGVYNRKTGYPTVYEPKQGVAEGRTK